MNQINKTNVTMWKNRNAANDKKIKKTNSSTKLPIIKNQKFEESSKIENEFIENLKKQIYFMEMELKLMKEREREIAKSGGFTQLFNDDKDPAIHIQQLKVKYANMRKKMEDQIVILNDKKREIKGQNVSLKAKLANLQKFELEAYNKLKELENKKNNEINNANNDFSERDNERVNIEAENRLQNTKLKAEINNNEDLSYQIESGDKIGKMTQDDFDDDVKLIENLAEIKGQELSDTRQKIQIITEKAENIPGYKDEEERNENFKKQIEELREKALKLNTEAECVELANNYLIKKKNDVVNERKKYIDLNVELRHEIDAKKTLNDTRIQKKVREANSEEIQEITEKLNETNQKVQDLENKIQKEIEKTHKITKEIIKANIQINHRKEVEDDIQKEIQKHKDELEELKKTYETCDTESDDLKDKIGKEKTENELLKNRNKLLKEENAAVTSKYEFITKNYDFTTNLKKISIEDLKNLAQSNSLVNNTIDTFVDKVGAFKRNNVHSLLIDDDI